MPAEAVPSLQKLVPGGNIIVAEIDVVRVTELPLIGKLFFQYAPEPLAERVRIEEGRPLPGRL